MSNRVRGVGSKKNSSNWRKTRSESGRVTYEKVNNAAAGGNSGDRNTVKDDFYYDDAVERNNVPIMDRHEALTDMYHDIALKDMDSGMLRHSLYCDAQLMDWNKEKYNNFIFAAGFAALLHDGQTRMNRGNLPRVPYIEHPYRNTLRLIRWGVNDSDILVATLLHDTVEDCPKQLIKYGRKIGLFDKNDPIEDKRAASLHVLESVFNKQVAQYVDNVTLTPRAEGEDKLEHYKNNLENKLSDAGSFLIKLTDYYDNAAGLHNNYVSGVNDEKISNMMNKYLYAWDVLYDKYNDLHEDFSTGYVDLVGYQLRKAKSNLRGLEKELAED